MPTPQNALVEVTNVWGVKYLHAPTRKIPDIDVDPIDVHKVQEVCDYVANMAHESTGPNVGDGGLLSTAGVYLLGDNLPNDYFERDETSPWQFTAIFGNYGVCQAVFAVGGPDEQDNYAKHIGGEWVGPTLLLAAVGIGAEELMAMGRVAFHVSRLCDHAAASITRCQ